MQKRLQKICAVPKKVAAFEKVVQMLMEELLLPEEYKMHPLKGIYSGCLECHIENDYLLIWTDGAIIELIRIGSHSELFKL
ncbi:MAG: type II toxin-antitoxin system YafQ family toxin [Tannerellaceae bacterium]|nr:type II toxin-antitoxin system YafQ family toxin [Tannerellaceae bacterium]